ncbi:MAG: hypothetical protein MUP44_00630, partial [Anaerolineales bacterium]|nr:hypothetical protein [Anaerolineales bacterium]
MSNDQSNELTNREFTDPRWKDLYKIGWITSIISVVIVILAITAFFIWPYAPGFESTDAIFTAIQ